NFAYILDYLPNGRQTDRGFHREPLALAVGEEGLKLFELVPKPGVVLKPGERIPLLPQDGVVPPIDHVRRRVGYDELTVTGRTELTTALEAIVRTNSARYLRFFNESPAVSRTSTASSSPRKRDGPAVPGAIPERPGEVRAALAALGIVPSKVLGQSF